MIDLIFKVFFIGLIAFFSYYYFVIVYLWFFSDSKCSEEETKRFLTLLRRNRGEGDDGF